MAFSAQRIFAAGAVQIDRVGRPAGAFQPFASSPGNIVTSLGGPAYHAALALRRCGAEVALFSGRGGDADGAMAALALSAAGIDDLALTWLDRASPSALAILDDDGALVARIDDTRLADMLSGRVFSRKHLREAMGACDALIFDATLPASGIGYLLKTFAGRTIAAIGASPSKVSRLTPRLTELTLLFLSRAEAARLVEMPAASALDDLAHALAAAGVRRAVITGDGKATILDDGTILMRDLPSEAVAGGRDRLAGATTLAISAGWSFTDAVDFGITQMSADPQDGDARLGV